MVWKYEGSLVGTVDMPAWSMFNPKFPDLMPLEGELLSVCTMIGMPSYAICPTVKISVYTTPLSQYPLPKHSEYVYPSISCAVLDAEGSYLGMSPCCAGGSSVDSMDRLGAPLSPRK